MIRSPCKGCYNEDMSKIECIKNCKMLHIVQELSTELDEEIYTYPDEVSEEHIFVTDDNELSVIV